jgi:hypothetical protein
MRNAMALLVAAALAGTATTAAHAQTCRVSLTQSTTKTSASPGGHTSTTTTTCHYDNVEQVGDDDDGDGEDLSMINRSSE